MFEKLGYPQSRRSLQIQIRREWSPPSLIHLPSYGALGCHFYVFEVSSHSQIEVFEAGGNGWVDPKFRT